MRSSLARLWRLVSPGALPCHRCGVEGDRERPGDGTLCANCAADGTTAEAGEWVSTPTIDLRDRHGDSPYAGLH